MKKWCKKQSKQINWLGSAWKSNTWRKITSSSLSQYCPSPLKNFYILPDGTWDMVEKIGWGPSLNLNENFSKFRSVKIWKFFSPHCKLLYIFLMYTFLAKLKLERVSGGERGKGKMWGKGGVTRILEEEKWKWTWQFSGRQGITDLSGNYRLWLWNPLFLNKIILKALKQLLYMQPVDLLLLSVTAQKVLLLPEKTLLDFHYCNWQHTHGEKSTDRRSGRCMKMAKSMKTFPTRNEM